MPDFDKMTKAQIGAHATEIGLHLDERSTKAAMIEAITAHMEAVAPAPVAEPVTPPEPAAEPSPDLIQVTVVSASASPARVAVNGEWWTAAIGKPVALPPAVVAALEDAGATIERM
jgi:hypothetical protein